MLAKILGKISIRLVCVKAKELNARFHSCAVILIFVIIIEKVKIKRNKSIQVFYLHD